MSDSEIETPDRGVRGMLVLDDGTVDVVPLPFALPAGTVTFLLTDVEGSTVAWQRHPLSMSAAVARHDEIVGGAIAAWSGARPVEQGEGDSVVAAFSRATDAIAAAFEIQLALQRESWPDGLELRVRIGVHTGEAVQRDEGNYVGTAIIRTARIRDAANGGQILVSESAAAIAGDGLPEGVVLVDVGAHRLKGLDRPEQLWLLTHPDLVVVDAGLRTVDTYRHNLPGETTPLIGRVDELAALADELGRERLVTLTGSGGVGKTRLAARVGADVLAGFPGGVWWVDLAPLRDPAGIGSTLLAAIGANEDGSRPAVEIAKDRLSGAPTLVVFDNCEHLVADAARVIESLRSACPNLVVLATSREPLGLSGEVTWRVPSLSLPARDAAVDVEALDGFDAIRLFLDRARRARPDLRLSAGQIEAIVDICQQLDGIPLAIELAAARCRQLPPERIAEDLGQRFRLLTGGARTLLPRQQTLLASVEWSHDLLDDDERRVLRRLSVCSGCFRLGLAESLGAALGDLDEWAVMDLVGRLVDKSLVQLDEHTDRHGHTEPQYRLLETVRQYALDRAAEAGELAVLRDGHADWWIAELERIDARQPTWDVLDLLGRHVLDLRAALDWLEPDQPRRYSLLALVSLGWSWGGHTDDVLHYVDRWVTIDGVDRSVHWARAFCASMMAMYSGMRECLHLVGEAFELVAAAQDGRAALATAGALIADPDQAPRRFATAVELAIADGCDVHLASFGVITYGSLATEVPDAARRYATAIDAAIAGGRCPTRPVRLCDLGEEPNAVPRCATRFPDVELRNDDLILVDRFLYVAYLLSNALIHGRTDQFDTNLGFLARYPNVPIARHHLDALGTVRKVIDGDEIDQQELQSLAIYCVEAPIHLRLASARAAVSYGGRRQADRLISELARGRAGKTADALMQAVLALHDDRVLDSGRLVTEAMAAEADFVWIELQPDLLEVAAIVASRCDDHERALDPARRRRVRTSGDGRQLPLPRPAAMDRRPP